VMKQGQLFDAGLSGGGDRVFNRAVHSRGQRSGCWSADRA
jgi:hypothetical protein